MEYPSHLLQQIYVVSLASDGSSHDVAHGIFSALREMEDKVDVVYVEGVESVGLGAAVMNRLKKAASSLI
jgi:hypothetical protein